MRRHHRSPRYQRLAELLAQYRRQADLKQIDVAEALGRYQPLITAMENGQRRIDVIEFLELAEIIGFDPHVVLGELIKMPKS
jgi:transcriptional regulator with XRE-family HTH domain